MGKKEELEEIENLALNLILHEGRVRERQRILLAIEELEKQSHQTRTPIYQETMFEKVRQIVQGEL